MLNGLDKIEGLTPEQIEAINSIAGGLISKKAELEEKLSKTKSLANENQSAVEKLAALEALQKQKELEDKQNYDAALSFKEKEYNSTVEKLKNILKERDNFLVSNALIGEFMECGVHKEMIPTLQKSFMSEASVVDGKAMIGDKSLSEYIKEWSETPAGKAFRSAPSNTNGDGGSGSGSPQKKAMSEMSGAERTALFKSDPAEFNRLKAEMQ